MSVQLAGHFLVYRGMMDMILHGTDLSSGEILLSPPTKSTG